MSDKKNDSPTFNENEQNKLTNPTNQVNPTEKQTPIGQTRTTERDTPVDQVHTNEKELPTDRHIENEQQTEREGQTETTEEITPFTQSEWNNKKAKLQQQFPQLTEADLAYEEGKHNELYNRVETRLDKTNFEVKSMINDIK